MGELEVCKAGDGGGERADSGIGSHGDDLEEIMRLRQKPLSSPHKAYLEMQWAKRKMQNGL